MSKRTMLVFALVVAAGLMIAACGATATPTPVTVVQVQTQVVVQTKVVETTKVVEKVVTATPVPVPPTATKAPYKANLEITLMTTDRADRQKLAQVIQAQWKAANVGTNLQFLYGRGLFATCQSGGPLYCRTFDAAIYTWVGGDDPGFWGLYNCAGIPTKDNNWSGQNNPGWCNKDADAGLNQAENNPDVVLSIPKRQAAYAPFFAAWTTEVPVIPLFVNSVPVAAKTTFKNYTCGPTQSAPCGWNSWQWDNGTDTAVLALQQEPDTLHPGVGSMMARTIAIAPIFVGCMAQNDKAQWVPLGCESIPTVDNGGAKWVGDGGDKHLEVTYKIRKDWRWTDGTPVTSKDVLAWWKLYMDPDFPIASRVGYEKLYDIKAVDSNTVTVLWLSNNQAKAAEAGTLTGNVNFKALKDDYVGNEFSSTGQPVVDPLYYTFMSWLPDAIVSKTPAKDQEKSDFAKKPMGDGPYVVKEWKAGQELDLVKSDKPFPLGDPKITNIVWRFYGESKAVVASLQKGEIDGITSVAGLTVSDSPDLDKIAAAGVYKVWYYTEYSWEHIDLNTTKFPLDDVKVRQALYYLTDKKSIIDSLYYGKYVPAELPGAILATNSQYFTDKFTHYSFDLAKGKALLADAGWDCKALPCTKTVTPK